MLVLHTDGAKLYNKRALALRKSYPALEHFGLLFGCKLVL